MRAKLHYGIKKLGLFEMTDPTIFVPDSQTERSSLEAFGEFLLPVNIILNQALSHGGSF